MTISTADLVERLKGRESLAAIAHSLLSLSERELWWRCAAVRRFDRSMFETLLRPPAADEAISFEEAIESPEVEALAALPGFYRLKESARRQHLEAWILEGGAML